MPEGKVPSPPAPQSGQDSLAAQAEILSRIAAHPAFVALVQEIQYSPQSERLAVAQRLASVETLRARGIELPEGFRFTTRYFEDPNATLTGGIRIGSTDSGVTRARSVTICASVGFIACLSVGGTEVELPE